MRDGLMVSAMDLRLAREYVCGVTDEQQLRSGILPSDASIIAALKELLAEARSERDELQIDLAAAVARITELEGRQS